MRKRSFMKFPTKKWAVGFSLLLTFASVTYFAPAQATNSASLFFSINASDSGSYSLSAPRQWTDLSSAQRNGTIMGTQGLTYNAGTSSLQFPGGSNSTNSLGYVDMGSGFSNFGTGITIEFEGHFGANNQAWERVFDFGNGAEGDNIWVGVVGVGAANRLAIEIWRDDLSPKNTAGRCVTSTGLLTANQFDKWVITLDGAVCRMYRNGTEVSTTRIDGGAGSTLAGPSLGVAYAYLPRNVVRANNYIGRSNWGVDAAFDGALKYVRIYTEAISPQDVATNAATYTLTYASTGADSGSAPAARSGNGLITLESTAGSMVKAGHTFSGWATSAGQSTAITGSYNLVASTTLHPVWTPNLYTVTYDEHGGSTVPDGSFPHGGSFNFPANPTRSGYTFDGWFLAATGGSSQTANQVAAGNSSITLHAQWSVVQATTTTTTVPLSNSTIAPSTTTPSSTSGVIESDTISENGPESSPMPRTGNQSAPLIFIASILMLIGHLVLAQRKRAVH